MASRAPGAEFLDVRLARAAAVPPAERSHEVAAFVESMQLLREARELLPLTPGRQPVLPDTAATRRQVRCLACTQPASAACHRAPYPAHGYAASRQSPFEHSLLSLSLLPVR
jgi:hypothetical protein